MNNPTTSGTDLATVFDSLRAGQVLKISFQSCMAATDTNGIEFTVGRRSHSKKYNVSTVSLYPAGRPAKGPAQFKLYKRANGNVSMAHGNMAVMIGSVEAVQS